MGEGRSVIGSLGPVVWGVIDVGIGGFGLGIGIFPLGIGSFPLGIGSFPWGSVGIGSISVVGVGQLFGNPGIDR